MIGTIQNNNNNAQAYHYQLLESSTGQVAELLLSVICTLGDPTDIYFQKQVNVYHKINTYYK